MSGNRTPMFVWQGSAIGGRCFTAYLKPKAAVASDPADVRQKLSDDLDVLAAFGVLAAAQRRETATASRPH